MFGALFSVVFRLSCFVGLMVFALFIGVSCCMLPLLFSGVGSGCFCHDLVPVLGLVVS